MTLTSHPSGGNATTRNEGGERGERERIAGSEGFRHEALLYAGSEQFVTASAQFVREGLNGGEAILVAVIEPRASLLREELGPDAPEVEFLDMADVGRNPARIIPAWQEWVERNTAAGRTFRGIGEPIWATRTRAEIIECQQHEQLLNTAFDSGPAWSLLCPYDVRALPQDVIERAGHTHPAVVTRGTKRPSTSYPHEGLRAEQLFAAPLPAAAPPLCELWFDIDDLSRLRAAVHRHAQALHLDPHHLTDFVLVVSELAANSICYGGGKGRVRLWHEGNQAVCEVHDDGLITDPLVGRRRPNPRERVGGAGLWTANQLCDLLLIRSTKEQGTTVRAYMAADPEAASQS
jgi:anti-sigma regulatory factor (Ser/Thr protein kinase)